MSVKMAKTEACQVFIEQEIDDGLKQGKTPYSIGRELSAWVEKLFEAKIKPTTIEKRAERRQDGFPTNVGKQSNNATYSDSYDSDSITSPPTERGGRREGAGRKPESHGFRTSFTGNNEWYTPKQYVDAARRVMGGIDLDPASSELAQRVVMANAYYTKEDDGLAKPWHGRVWLNPPYSQPAIADFIEKAACELRNGNVSECIILTHNYTDTAWFHLAASISSRMCFTRGRIKFVDPEGNVAAAPTQGSTFFYFGNDNGGSFEEAFNEFGFIAHYYRDQPHAVGL